MRRLDITNKLKFEESPVLAFCGREYKLDDSAPAVLEVMEIVDNNPTMMDLVAAAKRIFGVQYEDLVKSCGNFSNLFNVIEAAVDLVTDDEVGKPVETGIPTMTSSPIGTL